MKHIKSQSKDWQDKEGYSKKVFLSEDDLKHKGALVQRLRIKSGDIGKDHHHKKQTEVFYFEKVNGWFKIKGEKIDLSPGDVLVVEPGDSHAAGNESDEDFEYMAFKVNWEDNDLYWD